MTDLPAASGNRREGVSFEPALTAALRDNLLEVRALLPAWLTVERLASARSTSRVPPLT
jgi:hypothetical protein